MVLAATPPCRLRAGDFGPVRASGAIPPTALRLWVLPVHEATGGYAVRSPRPIRLHAAYPAPYTSQEEAVPVHKEAHLNYCQTPEQLFEGPTSKEIFIFE